MGNTVCRDVLRGGNRSGGDKTKRCFAPHPLVGTVMSYVTPRVNRAIYSPTYNAKNFLLATCSCVGSRSTGGRGHSFLHGGTLRKMSGAPLIMALTSVGLCLRNINASQDPVMYRSSLRGRPSALISIVLTGPPFNAHPTNSMSVGHPSFCIRAGGGRLGFLRRVVLVLGAKKHTTIMLPSGILFRTKTNRAVHGHLLRSFGLRAVLHLPANVFCTRKIGTGMLFFAGKRPAGRI